MQILPTDGSQKAPGSIESGAVNTRQNAEDIQRRKDVRADSPLAKFVSATEDSSEGSRQVDPARLVDLRA